MLPGYTSQHYENIIVYSHPEFFTDIHVSKLDKLLKLKGYTKTKRSNTTIHCWKNLQEQVTLVQNSLAGHSLIHTSQNKLERVT